MADLKTALAPVAAAMSAPSTWPCRVSYTPSGFSLVVSAEVAAQLFPSGRAPRLSAHSRDVLHFAPSTDVRGAKKLVPYNMPPGANFVRFLLNLPETECFSFSDATLRRTATGLLTLELPPPERRRPLRSHVGAPTPTPPPTVTEDDVRAAVRLLNGARAALGYTMTVDPAGALRVRVERDLD